MAEKKIVVPEGMLKAAVADLIYEWDRIPRSTDYSTKQVKLATAALEAALRWLSENPIAPNPNHIQEVLGTKLIPSGIQIAIEAAIAWQQFMFIAPELEVPEEVAYLVNQLDSDSTYNSEYVESQILEAFRRGQKAGNR